MVPDYCLLGSYCSIEDVFDYDQVVFDYDQDVFDYEDYYGIAGLDYVELFSVVATLSLISLVQGYQTFQE
ncbi:MAG: hypothetical protein EZS28_028360 [Streblomastix strix]|uniref:Uncharacterized protein n=1 Tax=Streblomastix strix TaxID=222440 RepID=A0A5J4V246_9EUKA|nr:MAG: hypothetical protein EZS28_028360 [Streblomastix strix]